MDTVKRAAALLDRAKPGWENLIDTETLDLFSGNNCILGQVFGNFHEGWMAMGETDQAEMQAVSGDIFRSPWVQHSDEVSRWLVQIMNRRTKVSINTTEKVAA